jgi:GT2 family glycosyltransferase
VSSGGRVSIVVLTHDRRTEVLRTLHRLAVAEPDCATVVVDNASKDGSAAAIARRFPAVRVVRLARNIGAAGRNAGLAATDTPYVAFCDDDTWWQAGSLQRAVDILDAYPKLAVVSARVLVGRQRREDPTSARMQASPFCNQLGVPGTEIFGFLGGACVMRRAAFLEIGGYHRRLFLGGEEGLLAIDLMTRGWHMAYAPDLAVHHYPSRRRDVPDRRRLLLRNAIWRAWLRRPARAALRETQRWLMQARDEGLLAPCLWSALPGIAWLPLERRVIPARVEAALNELDAFDRRHSEPAHSIGIGMPADPAGLQSRPAS